MRNEFRGYYRPTADEFKSLWKDAEIVVDTNVLLNLYRYSVDTRLGLMELLGQLQHRLWVPHQVALEYQRNRIEVMCSERAAYSKIRKTIEDSRSSVRQAFQKHSRHLILNVEDAEAMLEAAFGQMAGYLDEKEALHPDMPAGVAPGDQDEVRDRLTELFEGRVGSPFSSEELADLFAEGAERYAAEIPPGYKDIDKGDEGQFGDLIVWKQILAHAEASSKSVILVTDEKKEDWWLQAQGQVVLPRPELVEEMFQRAGVLFYMYRSSTFMDRARSELGSTVSDEAVQEVQQVADRHEEIERRLHEHRDQLMRRLTMTARRLDSIERRRAEALRKLDDSRERLSAASTSRDSVERRKLDVAALQSHRRQLQQMLHTLPDDVEAGHLRHELEAVTQHLLRTQSELADARELQPDNRAELSPTISRLERERQRLRQELREAEVEAAELDRLLGS